MKQKQKRTKFGNKWTVYKGIKYHSKLEAAFAELFDELKKQRKIKGWTRQERVDCCVGGCLICSLYVDFLVQHNEGNFEYVEVKGRETDVWRLKYKLFKALYPSLTYHVAKQKHLAMFQKGKLWKQVFPSKS